MNLGAPSIAQRHHALRKALSDGQALKRRQAEHPGDQAVVLSLGHSAPLVWAKRWLAGDEAVVQEAEAMLAAAGLSIDCVMAQTLSVKMDDIDRIDRLTMAAESRRNVAVHEIDRYRATLAHTSRSAPDRVETTEYKVIAPSASPALEPA